MQGKANEDEDKAASQWEGSSTARLEAFSDGVFAVAITLLVLDIKVPTFGEAGAAPQPGVINSVGQLADYLSNHWPSYASYVLSFIVIGNTWLAHHLLFNYIERMDRILISLNLLLLLVVATVPFTTSLLANSWQSGIGEQLAAVIYSGTLFVQGIVYNWLWRYAAHGYRLLDHSADPRNVALITRRSLLWPLFYLISIGISFISVELSLAIYIVLPLFFFLPKAADRF